METAQSNWSDTVRDCLLIVPPQYSKRYQGLVVGRNIFNNSLRRGSLTRASVALLRDLSQLLLLLIGELAPHLAGQA